MKTIEHPPAFLAVLRHNRIRQREIALDDFALVGERVQLQTPQPKRERAVDLPGPQPPENLVAPVQETLL